MQNVIPFFIFTIFEFNSNVEFNYYWLQFNWKIDLDVIAWISHKVIFFLKPYLDFNNGMNVCMHVGCVWCSFTMGGKKNQKMSTNLQKKFFLVLRLVLRICPQSNYKVKFHLGRKFGCHPLRTSELFQVARRLQLNVIGVR